jgi:cell division transport system permease protein
MMRLLHRLRYFFADAWEEWRHSLAVNLLALATLSAALFVAGVVMLVVANVDGRIRGLRDEVRVDVFLADLHDEAQRIALTERLRATPGVARVEFVDKEEALRRYREWASDLAELVGELESNPLPASLEVFLLPGTPPADGASRVQSALAGEAAVEEVRFRQELLGRLQSLLDVARLGGGGFVVLILAAVVFVMGSVLRLAVFARREEIEIMQLVGASASFIRGPYLVAGAVQGMAASLVALVAVEGIRRAATAALGGASGALVDLVAAGPLPRALALGLVGVGLAVGLGSAHFAVRRSV